MFICMKYRFVGFSRQEEWWALVEGRIKLLFLYCFSGCQDLVCRLFEANAPGSWGGVSIIVVTPRICVRLQALEIRRGWKECDLVEVTTIPPLHPSPFQLPRRQT